jgi:pectate lyase
MNLCSRFLSLAAALLGAAAVLAATPSDLPLPAFPGAEGFGANTPGGRGGKVLFVTHLNDSGPGSLRAACEAAGPRIVIFRVSGTIALKTPIVVRQPYLTVAGQTAPGDGICLRDQPFAIATHDVVVRHIRSRLGDESAQEQDAFGVLHGSRDVVIDHVSATWSIDEALSLSGNNQNITIQWCLIGESLRQSKHAKGAHGYGSLARANGPVTFHHNLWIHNDARNPRLGDNYGRPRFRGSMYETTSSTTTAAPPPG